MVVGARILIVLEEDGVVLGYQQTGRGIAVEIVLERVAIRLEIVCDPRFRWSALERPSFLGAYDDTGHEEIIEAAVVSDEMSDLVGRRSGAKRISLACPIGGGIRTGSRKNWSNSWLLRFLRGRNTKEAEESANARGAANYDAYQHSCVSLCERGLPPATIGMHSCRLIRSPRRRG